MSVQQVVVKHGFLSASFGTSFRASSFRPPEWANCELWIAPAFLRKDLLDDTWRLKTQPKTCRSALAPFFSWEVSPAKIDRKKWVAAYSSFSASLEAFTPSCSGSLRKHSAQAWTRPWISAACPTRRRRLGLRGHVDMATSSAFVGV